jgi:hypothetical protein
MKSSSPPRYDGLEKHESEGKRLESAAAFGSTVKIAIGMKQLSPPHFDGLDKGVIIKLNEKLKEMLRSIL